MAIKKVFFILPLRTAINAIFDRARNDIVKENIEKRVALLHSDTLSYYLKESVTEEDKVLEYAKKGKQLNMPLTISTLDQLFNFVYKYNGFELKLATLSYSKIVIDEIQAYSPDLLAYLVTGLEEIVSIGGKFAILTATLPPFVKDYISENIKNFNSAKFTKGNDRHNLKVFEKKLDIYFIEKHFKENGGKTLIVCNTVKKAQDVYENLNIKNKKLIHSKFIKKDRDRKEKEIIEFGKTENKGNEVWVATSIIEASLDIDFDYLFTELNDLNSLFQRLGRVNRKGEKADMLEKPNAYVFTEINSNLFIKGDKGFIDRTIYDLSKKAIKDFSGILSEEKKVELIEEFLTKEKIKNSEFEKKYREIKNYINTLYLGEKKLNDVQKMFRNILTYNVIPKEIYENLENQKIIKKNTDILEKEFLKKQKLNNQEKEENKKLRIAKAKAKDEIYNFTVSVYNYELNKTGEFINFGYEKIEIVRCNYSADKGFERVKKTKTEEDNFDAFL